MKCSPDFRHSMWWNEPWFHSMCWNVTLISGIVLKYVALISYIVLKYVAKVLLYWNCVTKFRCCTEMWPWLESALCWNKFLISCILLKYVSLVSGIFCWKCVPGFRCFAEICHQPWLDSLCWNVMCPGFRTGVQYCTELCPRFQALYWNVSLIRLNCAGIRPSFMHNYWWCVHDFRHCSEMCLWFQAPRRHYTENVPDFRHCACRNVIIIIVLKDVCPWFKFMCCAENFMYIVLKKCVHDFWRLLCWNVALIWSVSIR